MHAPFSSPPTAPNSALAVMAIATRVALTSELGVDMDCYLFVVGRGGRVKQNGAATEKAARAASWESQLLARATR